jgi:uncharacterized membrane protein YebE (DUF533 family)
MSSASETQGGGRLPATPDPRLRRFLAQTVGSPFKLQVLVQLAAANPNPVSLDHLTARLGARPGQMAAALYDLIRAGLVSERFRQATMWYTLGSSAAARALTFRAYQIWQQEQAALPAQGGD